jgi:hypothetical protein
MSELKKRARSVGITMEELDAVDDSTDPRGSVISILLTHRPMVSSAATGGVESTPVAPEPEPDENGSTGGVAMTPEQVEFRNQ